MDSVFRLIWPQFFTLATKPYGKKMFRLLLNLQLF